MKDTMAKLSFRVAANGPDLRMIATLDGVVMYEGYPGTETVTVEHDFDDSQEQPHLLIFEMQGKLPEHTQVGDNGDILQDRFVTIGDIAFDDILLGHTFTQVSVYHHDTNGTTDAVNQPFYGIMGCNGRVEMRFSTPIYLWLLENM